MVLGRKLHHGRRKLRWELARVLLIACTDTTQFGRGDHIMTFRADLNPNSIWVCQLSIIIQVLIPALLLVKQRPECVVPQLSTFTFVSLFSLSLGAGRVVQCRYHWH